jgi:DeoR/GlpR family transcriptional regulator of sugar metabolism
VRYTQAPARREELLRRLLAEGYVSSAQASKELGVSEMTIRRDLRRLDLQGRARRVLGGARVGGSTAVPFDQREAAGGAAKRAIALACVRELAGSATLALDAGTTVAPLADLVTAGVRIVTHSAPVIEACTARGDVELIALGGLYHADTRSFAGPMARANLMAVSADVAVLSATAVDGSGLLCANALDAELKRSMADIAARSILLVDSSKLGARAPIRFGTLAMIDTVITDSNATAEQLELLSAGGTHVIVAEAPAAHPAS